MAWHCALSLPMRLVLEVAQSSFGEALKREANKAFTPQCWRFSCYSITPLRSTLSAAGSEWMRKPALLRIADARIVNAARNLSLFADSNSIVFCIQICFDFQVIRKTLRPLSRQKTLPATSYLQRSNSNITKKIADFTNVVTSRFNCTSRICHCRADSNTTRSGICWKHWWLSKHYEIYCIRVQIIINALTKPPYLTKMWNTTNAQYYPTKCTSNCQFHAITKGNWTLVSTAAASRAAWE